MTNYTSKPHTIEAFQFINDKLKPPQWFIDEVRIGKASVTINPKSKHITIYGEYNTEIARLDDWICRADHGKIYVLDNKRFRKSYQ